MNEKKINTRVVLFVAYQNDGNVYGVVVEQDTTVYFDIFINIVDVFCPGHFH